MKEVMNMKNKELEDWKEKPYFLMLTELEELNDEGSFTIARVIDGVNCVELHYVEGNATIEYGTRIKEDEWESVIEDIDWYTRNMTEEEISNKLWELFDYHYGEESKKTYTVCYDRLDVFNSKEEAKKFYSECYYMSEGAEHERYASILVDLNFSNLGKDNISKYCNEISIKQDDSDKFIKLKLDDSLSVEDAIKYYEEKVAPILKVSDDYGIYFTSKNPFEDFGSDIEGYANSSFSDYYKELLKKFNINVDNVQTNSRSDGKYTLIINDEEFDITAWDDLECVIDNVDSIIKVLNKDNEMEM